MKRDVGAVSNAVRHAAAAPRVLIAAFVEVAHNPMLSLATLVGGVQICHVAKGMVRVIGKRALIMKHLVMLVGLLDAAKDVNVVAFVVR